MTACIFCPITAIIFNTDIQLKQQGIYDQSLNCSESLLLKQMSWLIKHSNISFTSAFISFFSSDLFPNLHLPRQNQYCCHLYYCHNYHRLALLLHLHHYHKDEIKDKNEVIRWIFYCNLFILDEVYTVFSISITIFIACLYISNTTNLQTNASKHKYKGQTFWIYTLITSTRLSCFRLLSCFVITRFLSLITWSLLVSASYLNIYEITL